MPRAAARTMRRLTSRQRFAAIALIVALSAGLAAVAAIGRGNPHDNGPPGRAANRPAGGHGDMAVAADYLALSGVQLRSQLRAGRTLAQVADGTSGKSSSGLVQALVNAKVKRLTPRVLAEVNRVRARGTARGGGHVVASYLGLSPVELRAGLRGGKTLAQIADATPGKSAAGLIDVLVASRKARLQSSAAAGRLTQAKEQAMLSRLRTRVTARVNRARQKHR